MMLDAVERAASALSDLRLWCCFTEAPLRDAVDRRIAESAALRERVTLLGARPHAEMETLFRAADLFLQASHREAGGYSLIEAMACGTPPIATDIPPARRIIGDARALVPVGDAGAMARAIVDWAGRDSALTRTAARARFESALSFDAIGRSLRDAYAELAGTPRPA
jgi:glycosyltransferase involved in cell wall biosynthesis